MGVYKRGKVYWFAFKRGEERIQVSTHQWNRKVAIDMESTCRSELAKGNYGILEKKKTVAIPTLDDFLEKRFFPWVEANFPGKVQTRNYYRQGVRRIVEYKPLASIPLDEVTGEAIAGYVARRQSDGLLTSSVNRELQVLRRALHLAVEWGVMKAIPKLAMIKGEAKRERVVTVSEEAKYLTAVNEPLKSIATVLVDTGLRPEECFRLAWDNLNWVAGRHGTLKVTHGKTAAARRTIPMTPRARKVLESLWIAAGKPEDGWIWPARTRSGHVEPSTLRKEHAKAFDSIAEHATENSVKPVRRFVLYSFRHTFLTRLGESGCDAWTLARVAGHSSIAISNRYVHPSEDATFAALERLTFAGEQKLLQ